MFASSGGSAGTESQALYQQLLQRCATSNGIRIGAAADPRHLRREISAAIRRRSTIRKRAYSKASTCTPPDCISHGSGNVASTKRQIFSWPVSQGLYVLCNASTIALAAAKPQLIQPASVVKRAVLRLSCTVIGYVLETCLTIPMKRRSGRTRDFLAEPKRRQQTHPVCGFGASFQLNIRQGLLPPPASEETAMVFGAGGACTPGYLIRNHPLCWYTDGSGGKYGQDARLVRAGWGCSRCLVQGAFPSASSGWRVTGF